MLGFPPIGGKKFVISHAGDDDDDNDDDDNDDDNDDDESTECKAGIYKTCIEESYNLHNEISKTKG